VAIREFLVARANALKNAPPGAGPGGPGGAGPGAAPSPPRQENGHPQN
jgi:hypothetical protein